mgnify:CR=1 FL=1
MKTTITKDGNAWAWMVTLDGANIGGGWGRTKADAENDARIFSESGTARRMKAKADAMKTEVAR